MINFDGIQIPNNFEVEEIQVTVTWHFLGEESAYCKINWKLLR
jgi:hypothetical protein